MRSFPMSLHHYFVIFLFIIKATAATIASIRNQAAPPVSNPVDFKHTLPGKVETLTKGTYETFISGLRAKLGEGKEAGKSGTVPILPNYGNDPKLVRLFDVVLTAGNREVTVRIRRDNLYVRAYHNMETDEWMEFTEDDKHQMVGGSKLLGFGSSYQAMGSHAGTARVTNINYSRGELRKAVESLAGPAKTPDQKVKRGRALIVMAVMLSESTRFTKISGHLAAHIETADGKKLEDWMYPELLKNWSDLSRPPQCYDEYKKNKKEKYDYTPVTINKVKYETPETLRDGIFGVMLKETRLSNKKVCPTKKKLADEDEGEAAVVLSADM